MLKLYQLSKQLRGLAPLLALISLVLITASCCTQHNLGSLTGTVRLTNDTNNPALDPVDMSKVIVALYELAPGDTTLTRIFNEHPQIGFPVSQQTEFDHRGASPVKLTQSDATGAFSLEDVDPGTYNLVLLKEGWGIRYVYDVTIERGQATDAGVNELFPATGVAMISPAMVFKSDHSYFIEGYTSFTGQVNIEPRAQIFCAPGAKLTFYGPVATPASTDPSDAWKIIAGQGLYQTQGTGVSPEDHLFSIEFHANHLALNNGIIHHAVNGLILRGTNNLLENLMIRQCEDGITLSDGLLDINNLTVSGGSGVAVSLVSNSTEQQMVSGCVFSDFNDGVVASIKGTYHIVNCYFNELSTHAIRANLCGGIITHNAFNKNWYDIYLASVFSDFPQITYNNFYYSNYVGLWPHRNALLHYNNFYRTGRYFICIRGSNVTHAIVLKDFDAANNYWGVYNIDDYLLDANDNGDYPNAPCPYYIIYNPKRSTPFPDAGIQ